MEVVLLQIRRWFLPGLYEKGKCYGGICGQEGHYQSSAEVWSTILFPFLRWLNGMPRKLSCRSAVTRVRWGNCGGESGPRASVSCFPLAGWLWASCFISPYISLPFFLSKLWRAWEMATLLSLTAFSSQGGLDADWRAGAELVLAAPELVQVSVVGRGHRAGGAALPWVHLKHPSS